MNSRFVDLLGKTVGHWRVLKLASYGPKQRTAWLCECVCGRQKVVNAYSLTHGRSHHCGCQSSGHTTHGQTGTREFRIWALIKSRCFNPNVPAFKFYGGRGIVMCQRWRDSFEAFLQDMGECPPGFQIDRINNNGNYEPGNCRWTDKLTQANNTRTNKFLEFNGERLTYAQWARKVGIHVTTIHRRVKRQLSVNAVLSAHRL